jgi:hypothetical protein
MQNNGFAVKFGSIAGNAVTSGTGTTATTLYHFGNSAAPGTATRIGPVGLTFLAVPLTAIT